MEVGEITFHDFIWLTLSLLLYFTHKSVKSVEFAESQNRGINIFVLRKSTHRRGHPRACAECVEESKII